MFVINIFHHRLGWAKRISAEIIGLASVFILATSTVKAASMEEALAAEKRDDYVVAIPIYESFAAAGNIQAMRRLAYLSEIGVGGERDWLASANWLFKAYEAGDKGAVSTIGFLAFYCPEMPRGCGQTKQAALTKMVEFLASKGVAAAQWNLARILYNVTIDGLPHDESTNIKAAANLYLKAAAQGFPDAQFAVAVLYEKGVGFLQNYVEADKWYNLASANTPDKYRDIILELAKRRDALQKQMTPEQVQEAQELAKNWRNKMR